MIIPVFAPIILKVSPARKICASADEVDVGAVGNDAAVEAHVQKPLDGISAVWTVVERALVDVHSDEAVGQRRVEVASELHGVGQGLFAVVEGVLDTVAQGV